MSENVFIGHWYTEKMKDYRGCIKEAFEEIDESISIKYADSDAENMEHIWDVIKRMIGNSLFCIFDISEESRPNVFLEFGYALGKNKYIVLTSTKLPEATSNIGGYKVVIYRSLTELKETLLRRLQEFIDKAREHNENSIAQAEDLLSEPTAIQLLKLHKEALREAIFNYVDRYLIDLTQPGFTYDDVEVLQTVSSHITSSRRRLKGLRNRKVGDLREFVERYFSNRQLAYIIRNDIKPIFMNQEFSLRVKKERLHTVIDIWIDKVFEGFYKKISNGCESGNGNNNEPE